MTKPISILVENREVFAKLNYLRDMAYWNDTGPWDEEKELYMQEANCEEVLNGYVLTVADIDSILSLVQ
ncbi:hypothetical protein SCRM01_192 [Synechococcus phage S-CRM01]|uniref:hypothetical protein n=1 Tax=Synechococcus phage S-CRM01 TaxID=1026955 RepID=UPI000209E411|nr:hypothetical protein SCRM01_192 [Synechococcus phage S-CRM01]AEC53138.1 hypothetical protein SCRM01_192 [Synechococcus phage S-CRM01]